MIDGYFHVQLGGVKYRLAEDFEGSHYDFQGNPLRPPNAQIVSGDNTVFQARPDLLIHRWEDWSGGEGVFKFDREDPTRYWTGRNVDGFSEAGLIKPGPYMQRIAPNNAADIYEELVRFGNNLYAFDRVDKTFHPFTEGGTPSWGASSFSITYSDTLLAPPVGDAQAVFFATTSGSDFDVVKDDGTTQTTISTNFTTMSNTIGDQAGVLEIVANYIYLIELDVNGDGVQVWEISKHPATPPDDATLIYDMSDIGNDFPATRGGGYQTCATVAAQRLFFFTTQGDATHVHEILPTTAFATGYGKEIAVLPGFNAEVMWHHSGFLYMLGTQGAADGDPDPRRMIMYIDLQGSYGLITQELNSNTNHPTGGAEASGLTKSRLAIPDEQEAGYLSIVELDSRAGAVQHLTEVDISTLNDEDGYWTTLHAFNDRLVLAALDATTGDDDTYTTDPTAPMHGEECYVVSPWLDFGSTKTKLLSSFEVEFAETWAGNPWEIRMAYRTEVDGAWTQIDSTTDGSSLLWSFAASTSSSAIEFQKIQLKLEFYASGQTAVWPAVTSVQLNAQMNQKFNSWQVLLECTDEDAQAQQRNLRGRDQIDNVQTLGATATPVAFLDGYTDRDPNLYDTYDVVVDDYRLILERPGEGIAWVRLVEVA